MKKTKFRQQSLEEVRAKQAAKLKIYHAKSKEKQKLIQDKAKVKKLKVRAKIEKVENVKKEKRYIRSLEIKAEKLSHDHVRRRDSKKSGVEDRFAGKCCCCGEWAEGGKFQAGHWRTSGANGLALRYHPWNMHGQCANCNCWRQQEDVKVEYSRFMCANYSHEQLEKLRLLKQVTITDKKYFLETLIKFYEIGDEVEIVKFIESYL